MLTDQLCAAKRDKGWTQEALADQAGTRTQMIMRLGKGGGLARYIAQAHTPKFMIWKGAQPKPSISTTMAECLSYGKVDVTITLPIIVIV